MHSRTKALLAPLTLVFLIGLGGCINTLSSLMYAVHGENVPAEYDELKGNRIAVVTINSENPYAKDASADMVSRYVGEILTTELKECTVIEEDVIERWRDTNGWDNTDYVGLARQAGADRLVLIEISDLRLREGTTLYRGRAAVTTTLYDAESGKNLFRRHLEEFLFPVTAGQYAADTTELKFQRAYLQRLAARVARYFHAFDFTQDFAADAGFLSS